MLFSLKQEAPASIGGGTFTEGKEYTLVYHKEEEVFLVKDDRVPLEWCAEYNGGGQWIVEGLELIAEFKEL